MRRTHILGVILASLAVLLPPACADDAPATGTPSARSTAASATATPVSTPRITSTAIQTEQTTPATPSVAPAPPDLGDPLLDAIARAVVERDAVALVELTAFRLQACEERPSDIGSIGCPPGVNSGALVQVTTTGGCDEGGVLRADEAVAHWESILDPIGSDGFYRGPLEFRALARAGEPRIAGTTHRMLFAYAVSGDPPRPRRMLSIGNEGILDERAACDYTGTGRYFAELDEIIVEVGD